VEVFRRLAAANPAAPPGRSLPEWLIVVAWIPFTIGLALTFNARMQDVPWMLLLVYLADAPGAPGQQTAQGWLSWPRHSPRLGGG
jgi:hypothetical protein